jgi:hypothetical protein
MIKRLQRRFVFTAMVSLLIVLLLVLASINAINITNLNAKADRIIDVLAENGGRFPDPSHTPPDPSGKDGVKEKRISVEAPFATRYFIGTADSSERILSVDTAHITAVTAIRQRNIRRKFLPEVRIPAISTRTGTVSSRIPTEHPC